jgi:hypothetical protein
VQEEFLWEANVLVANQKNPSILQIPEGPRSQENATDPQPESDKSSPHPLILILMYIHSKIQFKTQCSKAKFIFVTVDKKT